MTHQPKLRGERLVGCSCGRKFRRRDGDLEQAVVAHIADARTEGYEDRQEIVRGLLSLVRFMWAGMAFCVVYFVASILWPDNAWVLLLAGSFGYAIWVAKGTLQ
jgi:hypothetical protein